MQFVKNFPITPLETFLEQSGKVTDFTSSKGHKYEVIDIEDNIMQFLRLDTGSSEPWHMELEKVYLAYQELESFYTLSFKKYVPRKHSPARGLLIHLKMLVPKI